MKCPKCGKSLWFLKTFCPFCQTDIPPLPCARRPASVIAAMVVFALGFAFGLWLLAHRLGDLGVMIRVGLVVAGLIGLVCFGRSRAAYYLSAAALGSLVLRAIGSVLDALGRQPFVRLDSPYDAGAFLGTIIAPVAILYLFVRFVFGRPSREFFGLARGPARYATTRSAMGESGGVR